MPILTIKDMKVVTPSPNNFILDLEISSDINPDDTTVKHYKYIASGEHIYQNNDGRIDKKLLKNRVAHSSIFKIDNGDDNATIITAFSLFDMNDMVVTTDENDPIDNLLLMPNSTMEPRLREVSAIPMHQINRNATYGMVSTPKKMSFGYPAYIESGNVFTMASAIPAGASPTVGDTLTLYRKNKKYPTNISNVLGLGTQAEVQSTHDGFDKMFVFDPTDNNSLQFSTNLKDLRDFHQSNKQRSKYGIPNDFDYSLLLSRTILFPKQTLNNEYSTERPYVDSEISAYPFEYARKYRWDEHFYSNGTHIVLNHREDNRFNFRQNDDEENVPGTMVTSKYSNRFTELETFENKIYPPGEINDLISSDNTQITVKPVYNKKKVLVYNDSDAKSATGVFNQYSPELINRENETLSDTALMTSKHKTNIFDIDFVDLWDSIGSKIDNTEVRNNLRDSIKTNLFKLVEEIKPVHTKLYKVVMESDFD